MFPHRSFEKYIWTCPDGKTHNQIDHILIDRGWHILIDRGWYILIDRGRHILIDRDVTY
jgi:hypothetical protein